MTSEYATGGVLPLAVLCKQSIITKCSQEFDFQFIKDSLIRDNIPDYNGYCTAKARSAGVSVQPKTKILFQPLIDESPTDTSTMLTAMEDAEKITNAAGQKYTLFTVDQQLYAIVLNIIWSNPERLTYFVPRLGGMHWLTSFIGACGSLMKGSGLSQHLSSAFAGVEKMLTGKKFPMNMRALRLNMLEILRGYVDISNIHTYNDLISVLNDLASKSTLAKHWITNLIKPVLLMMLYVRAEREGEFALHLYACKMMMPYFFAAKHINYARYGICYLNSMEKLPESVLGPFMKGEHVMRHQPGIWNAIWSDMLIETSYMKVGKGPVGVIGFTTSPVTMKLWAKSMHAETAYISELHSCRGESNSEQITHKMENESRIKSDEADRLKLRTFLSNCIHPLNIESHTENLLCNIWTGEIAGKEVNVHNSVSLGIKMMSDFKKELPHGFRKAISSSVITMPDGKKRKRGTSNETYNTDVIFSRVIYLMSIGQLEFEHLFSYELAPFPTALCHQSGDPRYTQSKSDLKNLLQSKISSRNLNFDSIIIDGNAMLHSAIHWPKGADVSKLIEGIGSYIFQLLTNCDIYLIFDRYYNFSIKSDTRQERRGAFLKDHKFTENTPLPSKEAALASTKNKVQLIEIIANRLLTAAASHNTINKLIITSANPTPTQIHLGIITERADLATTHEEADVIIPMQVEAAIAEGKKDIAIYCEDTDVFVLISYIHHKHSWKSNVYMKGFSKDSDVISISNTVQNHHKIMPSLPACHIISGCDTVPQMFRIGKTKATHALKTAPLLKFMDKDATKNEYMSEAKTFVARCYGCSETSSSENRQRIWKRKTVTAKITSKGPELRSLPPTDECLELNIARARFQAMIWESSLDGSPPNMDPCEVIFRFFLKKEKPTNKPICQIWGKQYKIKGFIFNNSKYVSKMTL